MEGEQFSLCWNNFHANLSSGFHSLFKDEDLVDVTIAAEGKFLKAHKTVLSVCSPFFKDLFRTNPCKHPIVILPDVNYNALCSLLHFMYQGEVSVSQEEIPTFMRVAEMLKVKGLTDNNPAATSETNGFMNSNRNHFGYQDQRQNIMKRPRPVKKIIRPIQQLRPIESPKLTKSPSPHQPQVPQSHSPSTVNPPIKKPLLENDHPQVPSSTTTQQSHLKSEDCQEPLIKPKLEPLDHHDEENTSHSGEDPNMDLSNIVENAQGEPSPSHSFNSWPPFDIPTPHSQDSSSPGYLEDDRTLIKGEANHGGKKGRVNQAPPQNTPQTDIHFPDQIPNRKGTIQCILGKRGCPRLIVDGFVFYKKSVYKGKAFWYCKNSRTPEKCQAVCWTMNGNIVKWPYMHCHPPIPDIFNPEEDTEVPIENLQEVLWQTSFN